MKAPSEFLEVVQPGCSPQSRICCLQAVSRLADDFRLTGCVDPRFSILIERKPVPLIRSSPYESRNRRFNGLVQTQLMV